MDFNAPAAIAWGLVYTISVFIVGVALHHPLAWKLALVTMGLAFSAHVSQLVGVRVAGMWLSIASWMVALTAGVALNF